MLLCGHVVVVWSCCCCVVMLMLCGHAADLHNYRCRGLNPGILTPSLPIGQHMTQEKSVPFEYFDVAGNSHFACILTRSKHPEVNISGSWRERKKTESEVTCGIVCRGEPLTQFSNTWDD